MGDKYILNLKSDVSLSMHLGNNNLEVTGEDIEAPYINTAGTGAIDVNTDFVAIEEADNLFLRIRPEKELDGNVQYKLHIPGHWEQKLQLETNNGTVKLENLKGSIDVRVAHGHVNLNGVSGSLAVNCTNGGLSGFNLDGIVEFAVARGAISLKECRLSGGKIKSSTGKMDIQMAPGLNGNLTVLAGNGEVQMAVPEDGNYKISVQSKENVKNHLEGGSVVSDQDVTTLQKGDGQFIIKVMNFNGGVTLMKWEDFGKDWNKKEGFKFDNFKIPDPGKFFEDLFGGKAPKMDVTDFLKGFADLNSKFEKFGGDVMKKFKEMQNPGSNEDEVKIVLEMLKEGKISTEDAERLINAMKKK